MMIPPSKCNITIYKGAKFELVVMVKCADQTKVNFAGYTGRMQIRPLPDSERVIASLTTLNGGIAVNGTEIKLLLDADVTGAIEDSAGVYDLEMVAPDGGVHRVLEGKVSFSGEVTR